MINESIKVCVGYEEVLEKVDLSTRLKTKLYWIASLNKKEFPRLAKKAFSEGVEVYDIDFILVPEIKELGIKKGIDVFYGVAEAYKTN